MTDRYRYPPPGPRSPPINPARSSLPATVGYSSLFAGDMHVVPTSTHPTTSPRGYATSTNPSGVPTTTRTYAVTNDRSRAQNAAPRREKQRARRSTLDSSGRPPVIVTTTSNPKDRGQPSFPSSYNVVPRTSSPPRDSYRTSEPQLLTLPSTSARRSRSAARPYHASNSNAKYDDHPRTRDRENSLSSRDADTYRNSRPSVVYPSDPRHSTATVDYGDDGYQYTTAGELVRYDLDHSLPSHHRRRESSDKGYHRPNLNYREEKRKPNVNTSPDLGRNYNMNTSRPLDGPTSRSGGPPPSTRGFDRINNGYYDSPRDVASAPQSSSDLGPAVADRRDARRARPVSLYQDSIPRSSHMDDYYRSRDDERSMRDLRDRERDRDRDRDFDYDRDPARDAASSFQDSSARYQDEGVPSRGFGIRSEKDAVPKRRESMRESRRDVPSSRRTEEGFGSGSDLAREERRRSRYEPREDRDRDRRDRRESQRGSDEDLKERTRFRDKLASSVDKAVSAIGLNGANKNPDDRDAEGNKNRSQNARRRISPHDERERYSNEGARNPTEKGDTRYRDGSRVRTSGSLTEEERNNFDERRPEKKERSSPVGDVSASDSDRDRKRGLRRTKGSHSFNPNDTGDLKDLKQELEALTVAEKKHEDEWAAGQSARGRAKEDLPDADDGYRAEGRVSAQDDKRRDPRMSSTSQHLGDSDDAEDSRGRELVVSEPSRQVRVVSPPRDKSRDKPLKGILKQPRVSFPEDANPVREGVAPHKDDKKSKDVPPGARWTKISRKIVNPEALEVGKERFEVRDDFCIVLRVLSKEEIQAYAAATQVLRERRRNGDNGEAHRERDRNGDSEQEDEDDDRGRQRSDEEDGRKRHQHQHHTSQHNDDAVEERDRDNRHRRHHSRREE